MGWKKVNVHEHVFIHQTRSILSASSPRIESQFHLLRLACYSKLRLPYACHLFEALAAMRRPHVVAADD
jgi:hypothetical protein